MARVRSPGYPNFPLADVVEYARKIHEEDRQHPVSREVAAQNMGFSGATGSSDRALSALMHFALAEKAAKGEIRVSDLAVRILYPHSHAEMKAALQAAAFNPELFQELRQRYPGSPPSLQSLSSYLARAGFAPAAIPAAARAYLETCYYLQREDAYESDSTGDTPVADSGQPKSELEQPVMQSVQPQPPQPVAPPPVATLPLNEFHFDLRGETVLVNALLDYDGLLELEAKLAGLKMLLPKRKPAIIQPASDPSENPPGPESVDSEIPK